MRTIRYWPRFLGRDNTMHSWQSHQSGRTPNLCEKCIFVTYAKLGEYLGGYMGEYVGSYSDEYLDECLGECLDSYLRETHTWDRCIAGWIYGWILGWTCRFLFRWLSGRVSGWISGWIFARDAYLRQMHSWVNIWDSLMPLDSSSRKVQEARFHSWKQVLTWNPTVSSVVQFYNCVNRLGTARIQLQEAPGGQIPLLEAGSHLKPYSQFSCSILPLFKPLGNRSKTAPGGGHMLTCLHAYVLTPLYVYMHSHGQFVRRTSFAFMWWDSSLAPWQVSSWPLARFVSTLGSMQACKHESCQRSSI